MVGRAALGRPWLVGQIAHALTNGCAGSEPAPQSKSQAVAEHYETILQLYGRRVGVRHARKHLAAYADDAMASGGTFAGSCRHELVTCEDPDRVLSLLGQLYDDIPAASSERMAA
jgi:tRNA-dihydrouridine synthase